MPDLPEAGQAAHGLDHVVGGFSARLVDDEHAVEGRRKRLSGHIRLNKFLLSRGQAGIREMQVPHFI
jgi:hypothetical protein